MHHYVALRLLQNLLESSSRNDSFLQRELFRVFLVCLGSVQPSAEELPETADLRMCLPLFISCLCDSLIELVNYLCFKYRKIY